MKYTFKRMISKSLAITVAVMMAATCFAVINTDYSYAAKKKKVTSVTLTNVGDIYTIKKGSSKKLKYSIQASKKKYKKVKWKSSNKKVVTVSKKGKIKAKKNGTAYITVYSKTSKKVKDKVKIVVATPVTSVTISGSTAYVKKGNTTRLSVSVKPSKASNKKLTWTSSNNAVATVSQSGVVTAKAKGTTFVKAIAKDGTGKYGWINIKVIELNRSDAIFIAHRGYSSIAPENTLPAFALASEHNFHGAEMDVWESKHYTKMIPKPDPAYIPPTEPDPNDVNGTDPAVGDVTDPQNGESTDPQTGNGDNPAIQEFIPVEAFDLNVLHNSTTGAMCGKNESIENITDDNRADFPIKNYPNLLIPTLEQVLATLEENNKKFGHDTMPVIELKESSYSKAAIVEILDLVQNYTGRATIISFNASALVQAQDEINDRVASGKLAKGDVQTQFLVRTDSKDNVNKCVSKGFDGVSIKYTSMTKSIVDYAHSKGLIVAAWTLPSMAEAARMIDLGVDKVTSDYRLFVGN